MTVFLIVVIYCILKSLYIMQKNYRFSAYLWMTAIQKFQFNFIKQRKSKTDASILHSDQELGLGLSNGNIVEQKELDIKKQGGETQKESSRLISLPSINSLDDDETEQLENIQINEQRFSFDTFIYCFKKEFCGKSNRSLYAVRNITAKSRLFIVFGMSLYLILSFFTHYTMSISPKEIIQLSYIQIFFFETLFALSFPNFVSIVTYQKEFTFIPYLTRLVALNLLHVILITFQLKKIELLVFLYYVSVIILHCDPSSVNPLFQTENGHQNTLEMYHLTFLGKIQGRFMFFYVRRVNEINFRIVLASAVNKQLVVHKEQKFDNKNVHKVYFNKEKKILTLWTKSPETGIEIVLYHVPSLKCLQITSLYRSPAANVYGYENCQQKYCLINKNGHNVHLFEGNVYLTAIPIPGRPGAYDDFFIYETEKSGEIILGKIQKPNETTEYKAYRIIKERKIWIAEEKIEFDELITHQLLINDDKILFISACWNLYVYDAKTLQKIQVHSNQLLPNSMYCQVKYHSDQQLFEIGIQKEKANFLIADLCKPKVFVKIDKKEFNSLFFLNYKPIILCFQKSGKFFKRTVNYTLYDLPQKSKLFCQLTSSQTDLDNFYKSVPEYS